MSAEEALYHKLQAHGEDDEHEEAHDPGTLHLAGESGADLTAGYEAYPREYEGRKPLDVANEGVSGCARSCVEGEREYGCGDCDLHGESEGIDEYRCAKEAAANAEETGYEAEYEVDEYGPDFVQAIAVCLARLRGDAAAVERLRIDETTASRPGTTKPRLPPRVELLGCNTHRQDDKQQSEHGIEDAGQPFESFFEHERGDYRAGNCGGGKEVSASLVHYAHIAVGEGAGYAVSSDERKYRSCDYGGVLIEEDTQDGDENEAAARSNEDTKDACYEPDKSEDDPLEYLLPAEREQPLNSRASQPIQPGHLVHRQRLKGLPYQRRRHIVARSCVADAVEEHPANGAACHLLVRQHCVAYGGDVHLATG